MKKILVMGAGSAQSNGVVNCLLDSPEQEYILGAGSEPTDLVFSKAHKKYQVPHCRDANYKEALLDLLKLERPDLIHFQHDEELLTASAFRDEITALGVRMFVPDHETIDTCVYKHKSYLKFKENGIVVPKNMLINEESDLRAAFASLGGGDGKIWLRSTSIGGGGKGAISTDSFEMAKCWIDREDGWGAFVAAEMLTPESVTFLSIWNQGELVVGQGRIRKGWHGRSVSGVTGVTKVGQIYTGDDIVEIALKSVHAVSDVPHGIYGVDMTYDKNGIPNPTEINIGRFFTTVEFFKEAGLNMPVILKDIALYGKLPELKKKVNPLKGDYAWLRAVDERPRLVKLDSFMNDINSL